MEGCRGLLRRKAEVLGKVGEALRTQGSRHLSTQLEVFQ